MRRTVNALCSFGETDERALAKIPSGLLNRPSGQGALFGSPATLHQRFAELEEAGVQELILSFPDILQADTLSRFAEAFLV